MIIYLIELHVCTGVVMEASFVVYSTKFAKKNYAVCSCGNIKIKNAFIKYLVVFWYQLVWLSLSLEFC